MNKEKTQMNVKGDEGLSGKGVGDVWSKTILFIACAVLGVLVISQWMSLRMTP